MRFFYGWVVVAATAVVACLSFGLGFYGISVYVATLPRVHGWSASAVSLPVTAYFVAGALLTTTVGGVYERLGPRVVVGAGSVAMAAGISSLGIVTAPWQLYPAFLVMSAGWAAMSGAAINVILAPWFERRRGLAVSLAFNGATLGGVLIAPGLILLIEAIGLARGLHLASLFLVSSLVAIAAMILRRGPESVGEGPDGGPPRPAAVKPHAPAGVRREAVRTWHFWSVSAPFALGLTAQVGMLAHLVAFVTPMLGPGSGGRAMGIATLAALAGRLVTGFVVDQVDKRLVTCVTLVHQIGGLALLAWAPSPAAIQAGCVLFGIGVGNLTTLPALIVAAEWPRERFGALISLVVGINQLTFAFGPSLVGVLRDWTGGYPLALATCAVIDAVAAVLVMLRPRTARPAARD
jgi:MFS family permease